MAQSSLDYFSIYINVLEASDLPNSNITSLVCVQVGHDKRYTKAVKHTDRPFFNEYFVFDLLTNFSDMLNIVITISIYEPRNKLKTKKLIGCISLDAATVWAHKDRQLDKWLAVTLPSDVTAIQKGFIKCEISIEAAERFKLLPQLAPMETSNVIGGQRARYMVRLYHCVGLEVNESKENSSDVFVRVSFAGMSGKTTKRKIRKSSEWNEQVTFIELFPPLHQKILVEIFVDKEMHVSKIFNLCDISDISTKGYLPKFGPTYVHLYTNEYEYRCSLLMAINTELVTFFKHLEKFHGVTVQSCQSLNQSQVGASESFLCYGVLFDAVLTNTKYNRTNDFYLSFSFGSTGRHPVENNENNTTTANYKALIGKSDLLYLPLNEQKPCVFMRSEWPDTCNRLFNSNIISKLATDLKERVSYAKGLILRGSGIEAKDLLKKSLKTVKSECSNIKGQLHKGVNTLDSERIKLISSLLIQIVLVNISEDNLEFLLEKSNLFLSILESLCEDIQDSLPSIVVCLKQKQTIIGCCKVHPREIIFSKSEAKRGISSGRISSIFLKDIDKGIVCRLDIWLWLGFWSHVSKCLLSLPPGHEDITKVVSLPLSLSYSLTQMYMTICYIYGGYIAGGVDHKGTCDPSVRVLISNQSRKTNTVSKSLAPIWKETIVFSDLHLYPSPAYIKENPPSLTLELWNNTSNPKTPMGTALVFPRVRLQPVSAETECNLQWIALGLHSQILAAFEIIQMTDDAGNRRLSQVTPQFLDPPMISYRLEVVFWGIRAVDVSDLKSINQLQATIQLSSAEVRSDVVFRPKNFPNFQHNLHLIPVELPKTNFYSPPLVVRITASNGAYVGVKIDMNIQKYLCKLPVKKQWAVLSSHHKSSIARAQARHSSIRVTMPDLIPLIDIGSERPSLNQEGPRYRCQMRIVSFFNTVKQRFEFITNFLFTLDKKVILEYLNEEEDEIYDWWCKYFLAKLKIYQNELEDQQEFNEFNDVLKNFVITPDKAGGLRTFVKVKAMMCLYRWPFEEIEVTMQGQDPEMGVLNQTELSDRVKILVRVYCIRAHNLHSKDSNGKADPYIEIATSSNVVSDKSNFIPKQLNPVFGRCLEITADLPVDSVLAVRVLDCDNFTRDDLIGETFIDLENRFYSKHRATCGLASTYSQTGYDLWRDLEKPTEILEKLCNTYNLPLPLYYEKSVLIASKEFVIQDRTINIEENKEKLALAALHHWNEVPVVGQTLVSEHVETRSLKHKARPGIVQGKLEMWVDLFDLSLGQIPPPVDISPRKPKSYELRVVILNTTKVPLVEDSYFVGRRHTDIFVKGWLWDSNEAQSTDVHYNSFNGDGSFNWRFIFPFRYFRQENKMCIYKKELLEISKAEVKVPALLHLQVWDSDRLSSNDFIGSMVLELCSMPRGARTLTTCKFKKTQPFTSPVDLFRVKHLRGWWPFLKVTDGAIPTSGGFLEAEFHLLTEDEAKQSPVGLGRSAPSALPPPVRPEFTAKFWLAPLRILVHLMCGVHKGKVILCLLTFGTVIFVLVGIYSLPMFFIKKLMDA